jgi:hypothetical protein
MSSGDTRKGFTQARFNDDAFSFVATEVILVSAIAGLAMSNWYVFGGLLIGMLICINIPVINMIMSFSLSLLWSLVVGRLLGGEKIEHLSSISELFDYPSSLVVGGLVFLISLGMHVGAIEYGRDLVDSEDRNFND